jgi:hypothetical protein
MAKAGNETKSRTACDQNTPMVTNGEESYSIERRQTTILLNGTTTRSNAHLEDL